MHILSINRGTVAPLFVSENGHTQSVVSAIRKIAVEGPIAVGRLGLQGDEQADLTVHGGLDKAVYLYPYEHYAFWEAECGRVLKRSQTLVPGMMGENLTTIGLLESALWVGDKLQMGEVICEVTEPRAPCYKFAARMGFAHAVKRMLQSGYTGVYLRVLQTGVINPGEVITLHPGIREVSIAGINDRRVRGRQRDLFP